ncbi:MAG TPA: xanthine dehydrogenase family protein subunit M [Burkholderiaceae bacterium]|nr:xanthine dehydrogenase family protein subunit M [Burkholderiaceae bacterium]
MTVMESAVGRYVAPTTLEEALETLHGSDDVTILAGGTDLMPQSKIGRTKIRSTLMNIRRVAGLGAIVRDGDAIRIGALATVTQLMNDPLVRQHLPVLVEVCDHFASDQIRNAATIGGNVSNASPAGDTLVPLLVLDAEVELASAGDAGTVRRRVPLADYFAGPGRTRRAASELLTGVRVSLPPAGHYARFFKFGTRPALDISAISIAIAGVRNGGALSNVRVAFGAVAPTPVRARRTEQALEGQRLDAATIARAAETARDEVSPIDDVRASAWYRKELIHNMTRRMLDHAAQA